jgi:uncharacterized SAM-binding protein YcdF (DUF218 family)
MRRARSIESAQAAVGGPLRAISKVVVIAAAVAALGLVFHQALLAAVGSYLVRPEAPEKADLVIVLAGDGEGRRILEGGELVRQGYAPQALVSGPGSVYGFHECDLAIQFAVRAGYPEQYFRHMEHDGHSTRDEAAVAAPILHHMGVHTALLVTSNFHTRRAGAVFRDVMPDIRYIVIAVPDENFSADGWWRNREGRKIALLEWTKTIANWLRL